MRSGAVRSLVSIAWFACLVLSSDAIAQRADVTRIYIAPGGADDAAGSIGAPLASLHGARQRVRALRAKGLARGAVEVHIAAGEYRMASSLVLTQQDSGSRTGPVSYQSSAKGKAIFLGSVPLGPPTQAKDGSWSFRLPAGIPEALGIEQLFVNGKRARLARSPNKGYFKLLGVREEVLDRGKGRVATKATQELTVRLDDCSALQSMPTERLRRVQIELFHKWDHTRKFVQAFRKLDAGRAVIVIGGAGMKPWNPLRKGTRYRIVGLRAALDSPGEFVVESARSLVYVPRHDDLEGVLRVELPIADRFIEIRGGSTDAHQVEHIEFRNLSFRYAKHRTAWPGIEPAQAAAPVDAAILVDGARELRIRDCEVRGVGRYGVWFRKGCRDCVLSRSRVEDLGAGGVRIGEVVMREKEAEQTSRITIEDCVIRMGGRLFPSAVGVWIGHSPDNLVTHNEISDFFYTGVSMGWRWGYAESPAKRNRVLFNRIHKIGQGMLSDMAGIYTLGPSEGTRIANNVISDVDAWSYGGWGLYTDEGSSGIVMENNLVHDVKTGAFHQHYGRDNTIRNNIFAFSRLYQLQATRVEKHLSFRFLHNIVYFDAGVLLKGPWNRIRVEMDQNLYFSPRPQLVRFLGKKLADWQKLGRDKHSLIRDPGFRDPAKRDFRLSGQSSPTWFKPFDPSKAGPRH